MQNPHRLTSDNFPFRLIAGREVWQKLMAYVLACPIEVNGYGHVVRLDQRSFRLDDVFILPQVASAGHAEIDAEQLGIYTSQYMLAGGDAGTIRLQWHSHVHGNAVFSSVDDRQVESYGTGWMLSLVLNKRGDFQVRLDQLEPLRGVWPVEVTILDSPSDEQLETARREITENVRTPRAIRQPKPVQPDMSAVPFEVPADRIAVTGGA